MILHSYLSGKVEVRKSGINKRGIFAVKPLKKAEVIAVWGGFIITQKEFNTLARKDFRKIDDYATKVSDGFYLVSSKKGRLEDDDFFNHSCNPNAGIKGHILTVAMRDIRPGEEITYDYCMTDADYNYSFKCNCGARNCRKVVTTRDWHNPGLQRRYKGFFSWYVQAKINLMKQKKAAKI